MPGLNIIKRQVRAKLLVHDNGKLVSTLDLEKAPLIIGTGSQAHIQLPASTGLAAEVGSFRITGSEVEFVQRASSLHHRLRHASKVQLGPVRLEVQLDIERVVDRGALVSCIVSVILLLSAGIVFWLAFRPQRASSEHTDPRERTTTGVTTNLENHFAILDQARRLVSNSIPMHAHIVELREQAVPLTRSRSWSHWREIAAEDAEFLEAWKFLDPEGGPDVGPWPRVSPAIETFAPEPNKQLSPPPNLEQPMRRMLLDIRMLEDRLRRSAAGGAETNLQLATGYASQAQTWYQTYDHFLRSYQAVVSGLRRHEHH